MLEIVRLKGLHAITANHLMVFLKACNPDTSELRVSLAVLACGWPLAGPASDPVASWHLGA